MRDQQRQSMTTRSSISRAIDALRHDTGYALRGLRRTPGLTLAIVLTLSLGVGANAAVFTAIDRVFFRAPPGVEDPGAIRRLYARIYNQRGPQYGPGGKVTPFLTTRDLLSLQAAARGTAMVAGDYLDRRGRLDPGGERVRQTYVSPGYFALLGVRPARGRFFAPDEDRLPGPAVPVAVISDAFWRRHFGADSAVIGRTVKVDDTMLTIVGIAPREFEGLELEVTDLWLPLTNVGGGDITSLRLFARLDRSASPPALDQKLSGGYRRAHAGDPSVDDSSAILSAPLLAARGPTLAGVSVLRIPGMPDRNLALLARLGLLGGIVLVIAAANVASLLLMRALRRRREIAIRVAHGVSRQRLAVQLVTESVILALISGGVALLVANATGSVLRAQLSSFRWTSTVVDQRVIWFGLAVAIATGVAAGLVPALFTIRTDVSAALKSSSGFTPSGPDLRTALLVTQAALCTALLASGGMFLQSLRRAGEFDRGFDPDRTIQVAIRAVDANAEGELQRVAERLRALDDVEAVGRTLTPVGQLGMPSKVGPNASDTIGLGARGPSLEFVDARFMPATGIRLVSGRLPSASDDFATVAVLNASLAQDLFPAGNAVGSCVHVREPGSPCRDVIGVVRDVRWDVTVPATYRVYVPLPQAWSVPNRALVPNYLYVRMRGIATPADVARLRTVITPLMAHPADLSMQRLAESLAPQLRPWRVAATLFLVLGALGLAAAAAGIYGLVAYDVTHRSREIAVRIALGATSVRILSMVVGDGLRVVMLGIGAGVLVFLGLGRVMASLMFATSPFDPVVLAGTVVVLVAAAALASVVPAIRAMRITAVSVLSSD